MASIKSTGTTSEALTPWRDAMDGHVASGEIPGLVALCCQRGDVHVHTAGVQSFDEARPVARDSIFRIVSMTKPVAAAAAMILVDEGRLALDEPVDKLLPELANRRVLKRLDGPMDETVPANRPITLRDLLTLRMGMGYIMRPTDGYPIEGALKEVGVLQGMPRLQTWPDPDTWMARVGSLPLMYHPGEIWMYDLGLSVLGVLISRAADMSLADFLHTRIFEPLGMKDTAFYVPDSKGDRLVTAYQHDSDAEEFRVYDRAEGGQWSTMPPFQCAAAGLVSTADDYLVFMQMLLKGGQQNGTSILSADSVALMTRDHLTEEQRAGNRIFFGEHSGWGFGLSVNREHGPTGERPGRFGWSGGLGTTAYADPGNGLVGILLTQRMLDSPQPPRVFDDFWRVLYRDIVGDEAPA